MALPRSLSKLNGEALAVIRAQLLASLVSRIWPDQLAKGSLHNEAALVKRMNNLTTVTQYIGYRPNEPQSGFFLFNIHQARGHCTIIPFSRTD